MAAAVESDWSIN